MVGATHLYTADSSGRYACVTYLMTSGQATACRCPNQKCFPRTEDSAEPEVVIGSKVQFGGDSEQPERNVYGQDHTRRDSEAQSGAKRIQKVRPLVKIRRAAGKLQSCGLRFTGLFWY